MYKFFSLLIGSLVISMFWFWVGRPVTLSGVLADQRLQCASYTPFRGHESPYNLEHGMVLAPERLEEDIKLLSHYFSCVRIYSPTGLEALPPILKKYDMKLLLGIWVGREPKDVQKEMDRAVVMAQQNSEVIDAVIVGNEALLRKEVTGPELVSYIHQVRTKLPGVPLTYADVWEFWLQYPEVAPAVDFVTIHILPYWENEPKSVADSMEHVREVHEKIHQNFPDKEILIGETGWPSFGRRREAAQPGRLEEARYLHSFVAMAEKEGWRYNIIEAFDQPWKRNSEGAVGGYWGIFDEQRADKGVVGGQVTRVPEWKWGLGASLALLFILFFIQTLHCHSSPRAKTVLSREAPTGQGGNPVLSNLSYSFGVAGMTIFSIFLPLQIRDYYLSVRNTHEVFDAIILLCASLVSALFIFRKLKSQVLFLLFAIGFSLLLLREQLGLLFDARYRLFPIYGYFLPIMALIFNRQKLLDTKFGKDLVSFLGVFFLFSSFCIFYNETLLNIESDFWVLMIGVLGFSFMQWGLEFDRRTILSKIWEFVLSLRTVFFVLFVSLVLSYLIRFQIMESVKLVALCQPEKLSVWCDVRDKIGFAIYFRLFAKIGLLCGLLFFMLKKPAFLYWGSLVMTVLALVLYQLDWAWWGVALLIVLHPVRLHRYE